MTDFCLSLASNQFHFKTFKFYSFLKQDCTTKNIQTRLITGFLGKPEDPRTLLYKLSVFITAIPSFLIIVLSLDTFRILIFSQVVLSIQLPFTLIPLLILCRRKKLMGIFRSDSKEFATAVIISVVVILLNIYLLYSIIF